MVVITRVPYTNIDIIVTYAWYFLRQVSSEMSYCTIPYEARHGSTKMHALSNHLQATHAFIFILFSSLYNLDLARGCGFIIGHSGFPIIMDQFPKSHLHLPVPPPTRVRRFAKTKDGSHHHWSISKVGLHEGSEQRNTKTEWSFLLFESNNLDCRSLHQGMNPMYREMKWH